MADIKDSPAYLYALWCVQETERKAPRYVKLQAASWLRIADGEDPEAYVDEERYEKITRLLRIIIHPDLKRPMLESMEGYEWLLIVATLCTMCREGTPYYEEAEADFQTLRIRYYMTALLEIARKNYKALALDTPIPTPDGWKTMADIHPGDYVFARDGSPTLVKGESEIFQKDMYLVEFEDGEAIKASADHYWTVKSKTSKRTAEATWRKKIGVGKLYREGGWYEATTEELAQKYKRERRDGKGTEYFYRVPMNGPARYPEKDLPIDPYLLGAWLGDGCSVRPDIAVSAEDEAEMIDNLKDCGYSIELVKPKNRCHFLRLDRHKGPLRPDNLAYKLREIGVYNNKHIPDIYMTASVDQRMALLQGLMDTDGGCSLAGQSAFCQKKRRLAAQVVELLASLGIKANLKRYKATCNGKPCGFSYQVSFFVDKTRPCFRLRRKAERLKEHLADRMCAKSIVGIHKIPTVPSKCIMVEDEEHLYLAGKHFTPTHNTFASAVIIIILMLTEPSFSRFFSVGPDLALSSELKNAIRKIIKSSPALCDEIDPAFKLLRSEIRCTINDSEYTPLAYSRDRMDGRMAHAFLADEAGAMDDYPVEAMRSSQINLPSRLGIIISTQYPNDNNVMLTEIDIAKKTLDGLTYDKRYFSLLYEPDDDLKTGDTWQTDDRVLYQSNPVAVDHKYLLTELKKKRSLAVLYDSKRENFLCKHCNILYKGLGVEGFVDIQKVRLCRDDVPDSWWQGKPVYLGLDLSQTDDNTSVAMVCEVNGKIYAKVVGFVPAARVDLKTSKEKVDYRDLIKRGECFACGDETIDYGFVEDYILHLQSRYGVVIQQLAYDRYNALSTVQKLEAAQIECVEVKQHSSVLHMPTKLLMEAILNRRFAYAENLMLEINFQNARCTRDTNGNMYVNKKRSAAKVDMVVSLINALYLLQQEQLYGTDFVVQM